MTRTILCCLALAAGAGVTVVAGDCDEEFDRSFIERPPLRVTQSDREVIRSEYGYSVAIDGDVVVVGAPRHNHAFTGRSGSAYVLRRGDQGLVQEAELLPVGRRPGDRIGEAVAISGDVVVVGAPKDVVGGVAWVFRRQGEAWVEEARLTAATGRGGDDFGHAVAVDGNVIVVGAPRADTRGTNAGAAYVFQRLGGMWIETQRLVSNGTFQGALNFGTSLALGGDTLLVGAPADYDSVFLSGVVELYEEDATGWTLRHRLVASDPQRNAGFGAAVALRGGAALVGAPARDPRGKAYLFERSDAGWSETASFLPPSVGVADHFGLAVALHECVAYVAAPFFDHGREDEGAVFTYRRAGSAWREWEPLYDPEERAYHRFGWAVGADSRWLIVGGFEAASVYGPVSAALADPEQ